MWLAGRDDMMGDWSQAGGILRVGPAGPWFAAVPEEAWPDDERARAGIRKVCAPHQLRRLKQVPCFAAHSPARIGSMISPHECMRST